MSRDLTRREALGLLAALPLAAAFAPASVAPEQVVRAARAAAASAAAGGYAPKFFTPHEWETVRVLVDLVIPRDERSGSATDAGVPEFMDFFADAYPELRLPLRGGLAWLDAESRERWGRAFVEAGEGERTALLDDIAYPARARPEMSQGVAFFNRFRDLTASGFWSSRMGVEDLQYLGNRVLARWDGCPPEALRKLGVHY
ncbi:MAG TPA: gluconate 2-dehydrogenase subunit 3 family protein [Longimicrobiaceae bacterium]|nr:gluconate 2-dehydrogenase subunit 3 family protein [Longimicrobiaceae bacterium]